jgi:putative DNA primase/helicase
MPDSGNPKPNRPTPSESSPTRKKPAAPRKRALPQPSVYFEGGDGLRAAFLRDQALSFGPIEPDPYKTLYRFASGVWLPDGEREVIARVTRLLGDRFRPNYAHNVIVALTNKRSPFDAERNTQFLNLPNGLLDWRTGELHEHDPTIGILPRIPVEWDPDATCPRIAEWLAEVLPEDCMDLAYELPGCCMYQGNPLHKAAMLTGEGRNGKGTYERLIEALLGPDNVSHVTPQSLDENRFASAELYGKLANLVGDVDPKTFRVTERFKQATGGDMMSAERKHGQPFSFRCDAFIIAAFNKLPQSADTTEGFLSRWGAVLPFQGYFPEGVADPSVEDKLHAPEELRGLLVKSVEGLQRVIGRNAFSKPRSVIDATKKFRMAADPYRQFFAEKLAARPKGFVFRSDLRAEWEVWSEENGHRTGRPGDLYSALRAGVRDVLGTEIEEGRRGGYDGFKGIDVVESAVRREISG